MHCALRISYFTSSNETSWYRAREIKGGTKSSMEKSLCRSASWPLRSCTLGMIGSLESFPKQLQKANLHRAQSRPPCAQYWFPGNFQEHHPLIQRFGHFANRNQQVGDLPSQGKHNRFLLTNHERPPCYLHFPRFLILLRPFPHVQISDLYLHCY